MIAFVRGTVYAFGTDYVILDVGGVGYRVYFNHSKPISLGQQLMLFTYQQIREDAHVLFGFLSNQELDLFEKLISVKGLGPKTALGILTAANYEQVILAIEKGEVSFLKQMPGIGAKTASQIILDLKGKLVHDQPVSSDVALPHDVEDAIDALKALGYKQQEINGIVKSLKEANLPSTDAYIKYGLQLMMKRKGG